jgi:hypothetical protein
MRSSSVLFDQAVPAGQTKYFEKVLPYNGRVTKMTITLYPGQQKALQVKPYMLKAPDVFAGLTAYAGSRGYFSGDENTYTIQMNIPFVAQDKLAVDATNIGTNDYDLYVLFEIEYGGE